MNPFMLHHISQWHDPNKLRLIEYYRNCKMGAIYRILTRMHDRWCVLSLVYSFWINVLFFKSSIFSLPFPLYAELKMKIWWEMMHQKNIILWIVRRNLSSRCGIQNLSRSIINILNPLTFIVVIGFFAAYLFWKCLKRYFPLLIFPLTSPRLEIFWQP